MYLDSLNEAMMALARMDMQPTSITLDRGSYLNLISELNMDRFSKIPDSFVLASVVGPLVILSGKEKR